MEDVCIASPTRKDSGVAPEPPSRRSLPPDHAARLMVEQVQARRPLEPASIVQLILAAHGPAIRAYCTEYAGTVLLAQSTQDPGTT